MYTDNNPWLLHSMRAGVIIVGNKVPLQNITDYATIVLSSGTHTNTNLLTPRRHQVPIKKEKKNNEKQILHYWLHSWTNKISIITIITKDAMFYGFRVLNKFHT